MAINLNKKALEEIKEILSNPALRPFVSRIEAEERQLKARNMRDEVNADWLTDALSRIGGVDTVDASAPKESILINEATGQPHTVESMVALYRDRVGLDTIQKSSETSGNNLGKSASWSDTPLSKKRIAADDSASKKKVDSPILKEMLAYIDSHLASHRGYSDGPAIIFDLREVFGQEDVQENSDRLLNEIESRKKTFLSQNPPDKPHFILYHQPQKVNEGTPENNDIFENIKEK